MYLSEEYIESVANLEMSKRARYALEIMIREGSVTTKQLQDNGLNHPPRALADLKDAGVSFTSSRVKVDGRMLACYTLTGEIQEGVASRKIIPKPFRERLYHEWENRCAICSGEYPNGMLQADHRVPFRVGGDPENWSDTSGFMPLCGSDNRAKSWSCEHCPNWESREVSTCESCYWASPEKYEHVATIGERRVALTVRGEGVSRIDQLIAVAAQHGQSLSEFLVERVDRLPND